MAMLELPVLNSHYIAVTNYLVEIKLFINYLNYALMKSRELFSFTAKEELEKEKF